MEVERLIVRAVFGYLFLLGLIRVSGKRTVAQGTVFDFIVALILGDLIDDLLWAEVPAAQFVVAAGTLVLTHVAWVNANSLSKTFSRVTKGRPLMFMRHGTLLAPAMRAEKMNEREVEEMLRHRGLPPGRWIEVKSGWVETSGRPAVLKVDWAKTAQVIDLRALRNRK